MQSTEELESYLSRLARPFEKLEEGTYVVSSGTERTLVALRFAPPILVLRAEIGHAPEEAGASLALFRRLLELNASALLHSAYALEGKRIVLASALELESIDLNELEAVLADVDLALSEHVPSLHELVQHKI